MRDLASLQMCSTVCEHAAKKISRHQEESMVHTRPTFTTRALEISSYCIFAGSMATVLILQIASYLRIAQVDTDLNVLMSHLFVK